MELKELKHREQVEILLIEDRKIAYLVMMKTKD